jgi:hypothetical protein
MKKIITLLLSAILLLSISACSSTDFPPESPPPTPDDETITTDLTPEPPPSASQNPFETADMPVPFEYMGGDGNRHFTQRYKINSFGTMITDREFLEYLNIEESDFLLQRNEKLPGGFWESAQKSSIEEFSGIFYTIFEYDIPNEIIVSAIEKSNDFYRNLGGAEDDIFSDKDVEALLSRDFEKITAQFAERTAIVIADRAYSPYWLYIHTPEEWQRVGITPEMVEERLELFSEFYFTPEAAEAFGKKLAEFIGAESSEVIKALNS